MDDYDDEDEAGASSGVKRLGTSLGLKLRPWDFGIRSAKSEVSLIDFTDDSFSLNTPSPLTDSRQDTLKVKVTVGIHSSASPRFLTPLSGRPCQDTPSILDWPLPQPAYDEVAAELEEQSEDQEVRSIYKALTETEDGVSTGGAVQACRNESQSADLFQELQREVAADESILELLITHVFHVHPIKRCLNCPITVVGDGEAAGSHGNRPLPPLLSPPPDSGSSGTASPDLPASSFSFLGISLRHHLLFGGEAGVAPS